MPRSAQAQAADAPEVTFNAQTFHPAVGPGSVFTVEGTLMPRNKWPLGSIFFEYANRPLRLVLQDTGETYAATVSSMFTAHLMPGIGITNWLAVALDLPIVLYQGFDSRTPDSDAPFTPTTGGVGDLRIMPKVRLRNNEEGGFGVAAMLELSLPTGSSRSFRSEDTFGIEPRLILDYRFKNKIFIALNLGFFIRTYNRNVDFGTVRVSDELRYGLGIGVPLAKGLSALAELTGAASFSRLEGGPFYAPLEGYIGARYAHSSGVQVTVGGGSGFTNAVGSPNLRLFASISYTAPQKPAPAPRPVEDEAARAAAKAQAETDSDGDGLIGSADACPTEAGPAATKGCPDSDKDGTPDKLDKCPTKPGPAETGGCPTDTSDTDKDGLLDRVDKCPTEPGPIENNGCPDTDEDKDGIVDRLDKCPKIAGPTENEGCPLLNILAAHITLTQKLRFKPNSERLDPNSQSTVVALAKAINEDDTIKKVRIDVPGSGSVREAKKLSAKRAKVLKAALLEEGVAKGKLQVKGLRYPSGDEISRIDVKRGKAKVKKEKKERKHREKKEKAAGEKKSRHHHHHRKKDE